ncbi:unnamed protein product [Cyclocybe aegerita]|uniref:Sacsin/Nov domain-containing protein n=1 Tax=Cyclocybe aegerita TaxID=1973307 RepID=A0A8S0XDW2_CYCAE|nr:unnamed protein product [Cyclocybe aegerita]
MTLSKDALWATGHDETVEVNQRALIDKVLARYSGEFTVFRELLQNSDDAQSKAVEIRFETQSFLDRKKQVLPEGIPGDVQTRPDAPLPNLRTTHVHQWTFRNDGNLFRDEDWNRLKKIAEGNPDEEKIGAFGVGFYSLFSVTEEPFVTSGDQWMGFYWKDGKDQLYARRGQLPNEQQDTNTSFTMALREPTPVPVPFDFTRFLASSLTFMRYLSEVNVFYDDKQLVKLSKATGVPRPLSIPAGLNNRSPTGIMTVDGIQSTPLRIQAEVMKWIYLSGTEKKRLVLTKQVKPANTGGGFFASILSSFSGAASRAPTPQPLPPPPPKAVDPLSTSETSVSLSIYSASIRVKLDKKMTAEIHRSTKKNPPTTMKFELIYTAKDEYDASCEEDAQQLEATGSIFQGLRADLQGAGTARVFIGHSTAQSTGLGGHVAARFIPTVERESIDFMDRHVAIWNKELLFIGGFLSRAAYEIELSTVRQQWEALSSPNEPISPEARSRATKGVLHALKFFMFYPSTPSAEVSSLMEAAFFECSSKGLFPIMSSKGVRNSKDVRLPNPEFTGFLKDLAVLPEEIVNGAPSVIASLHERGLIKDINFNDVLQELQRRPLKEEEAIACLQWWINNFERGNRNVPTTLRSQLINATILTVGNEDDQKIIPLASVKHVINPAKITGRIPPECPLPDCLLPLSVSQSFKPESLCSSFPWTEFTIEHWIVYLCDGRTSLPAQFDFSLSPAWAERVITTTSNAWKFLPRSSKESIVALLHDNVCVPTSNGMKKPEESYFPNVNIFGDLPVITFPTLQAIRGPVEVLLTDLGVRKHVELQIVFNRMIKTNTWTVADLMKYLVSVRDTLAENELERLKATAIFHSEAEMEDTQGKRPRYKAAQLYEPLDVLRGLGLPVIDWGHKAKWRSSSDEAKFLFELGLQRYPILEKLIDLCTSNDANIRSSSLKYLIDNLGSRYKDYDPVNFKDVAFIPALKGSDSQLGTIKEVFSNAEWASLGFLVLDPKYRGDANKLLVKENPPAPQLVTHLRKTPPADELQATKWFGLFATRVNDFKNSDLQVLSQLPFVPVRLEKSATAPLIRWFPPSQCYLGNSTETFHSKLFTFVNFGTSANAFLSACGTRNQPTVEEVVKMLLDNPRRFYDLAGGPTNFLAEIRNVAVNAKNISPSTIQRMKRSPVLLGLQRKPRDKKGDSDQWDDDEWDLVYDLKRPNEIVIADDTQAFQTFSDSAIFTSPQEDIIEDFYISLGSPRLSRIVREEYTPSGPELPSSKRALETRSLILERLPLFLHEHTHARTRVTFSWLSSNNNFVVRSFGKIAATKHLNLGELRLSRRQDASAVGRRVGSGPIELWIADSSQIDMYEVATSLNRLIFDSPKTNDALLFMTILSTDLRSLKRRGYNVDRILRQQKEARTAAELARVAKEKEQSEFAPPPPYKDALGPEPKSIVETKTPPANQAPENRPSSSSPFQLSNFLKRKLDAMAAGQFDKIAESIAKEIASGGMTPSLLEKVAQEIAKRISAGGVTDGQLEKLAESVAKQMLAHQASPSQLEQLAQAVERQVPANDSASPQLLRFAELLRLQIPGGSADKPPPIPDKLPLSASGKPPPTIGGTPSILGPFGGLSPFVGTSPSRGRTPDLGVTPWKKISDNIELAVQSCKQETGDLLHNRESMQKVKESVDDGYCDISGRKDNLHHIAQMGPVKIYLSDEVLPSISPQVFLQEKEQSISRFIHIMQTLASVYELPVSTLHIFYDLQGGIIGFNRNSSIFLNLRYFIEWHDSDVLSGNLEPAYISWYFTIAHEIAHNLVHPHNSEHEFYFSAISERFLTKLIHILGGRKTFD